MRPGEATRRLRHVATVMLRWPLTVPGERLGERFGVTGAVTVVFDARLWALTYDLARPHIARSSGLLARLADEELSAVLYGVRRWFRSSAGASGGLRLADWHPRSAIGST